MPCSKCARNANTARPDAASSANVLICSYECTFCAACAGQSNGCANCGGTLVDRPTVPRLDPLRGPLVIERHWRLRDQPQIRPAKADVAGPTATHNGERTCDGNPHAGERNGSCSR